MPTQDQAPDLLLDALRDGRFLDFSAREAWTGAEIGITGQDEGRYLVTRVDPNGSCRSEWRSSSWIQGAIRDGHWLPIAASAAPPQGDGTSGTALASSM